MVATDWLVDFHESTVGAASFVHHEFVEAECQTFPTSRDPADRVVGPMSGERIRSSGLPGAISL